MSIRVMSWVWDRGPARGSELLVLLALADFANDDGECWPSMRRIAEKARMTERGAQKIARRLVDDGFLEINTGGGRHGCNRYLIITSERANPVHPPNDVHPRTTEQKPRTAKQETPNPRSPEPSRTIKEPSLSLVPSAPQPKAKPKNASSLPDNWVPSDRNLADAYERGFNDQEIFDVATRFRDYHLAKGTRFKDWNAGWRTWLGNERRFSRNTGSSSPHSKLSAAFARTAHKLDRGGF